MQAFFTELAAAVGDAGATGRRWVYAPYDQLTARLGPLSTARPSELALLLVEAPSKASRRPYHKQKLFLVLANQRRFALEQAKRGVLVRYEVARDGEGYAEVLRRVAAEVEAPIAHMEPAERELRAELGPLVSDGVLEALPHEGWLTTPEDFTKGTGPAPPWRMDRFYRQVRKRTGILMDEDGKYEGGKVSFDGENRLPWPGDPPAPAVPRFRHGAIEAEVAELIETRFGHHPGELDPAAIPTRDTHAKKVWEWAKEHCLTYFGPFEDAMAREEANLFHTRVSPLLHLQRLLARDVVEDVASMDAPIASREGFVRQILGWREFVRHVHRATDGMRRLPDGTDMEADAADDAGWEAWAGEPWEGAPFEHGASPSALGSTRPLPPAYWGRTSGLACLDACAGRVVRDGYGHHIERLMVLSNLGTLLDVSPRELTDWFWCAYIDAFDWVVEPNVLGMGTYGIGDVMTTKPYVSGAAYIDRMSDFCGSCAFHPKKTCPITRLYWAFLARHADALEGNQRISMPLRSLAKRAEDKRAEDARIFDAVSRALEAGEELSPEGLAAEVAD
ncbi:MAG: cryptochrome/photolyase family protein [Planctomycetota bacterium]|nr:cryptochrome/photolyase family protein [Planctomycetota bacterium]